MADPAKKNSCLCRALPADAPCFDGLCMRDIEALLADLDTTSNALLTDVCALLADRRIATLTVEIEAMQSRKHVHLGFNCFSLISGRYYRRETLHSDVISAFLDPHGAHGQGTLFLMAFLEWLRGLHPAVDPRNYTHARVVREKQYIDILITDQTTKRAIIIENKMNGAPDQPEQIPRYLRYVEEHPDLGRCKCDAVLYLRMGGHSGPDTTGWSAHDRSRLEHLIVIARAYDGTQTDLMNGWLAKCLATTPPSHDANYLLRHYTQLIAHLGSHNMNTPLMEEFYQLMLDESKFHSAQAIYTLLQDLQRHRVERLVETFRTDLAPYEEVANYRDSSAYFTGFHWRGAHLGIDVVVDEPGFSRFLFWDRENSAEPRAEQALQQLGVLGQYRKRNESERVYFCRDFRFPSDEEALYNHIREFKRRLTGLLGEP